MTANPWSRALAATFTGAGIGVRALGPIPARVALARVELVISNTGNEGYVWTLAHAYGSDANTAALAHAAPLLDQAADSLSGLPAAHTFHTSNAPFQFTLHLAWRPARVPTWLLFALQIDSAATVPRVTLTASGHYELTSAP
jgi:hypothetical protein